MNIEEIKTDNSYMQIRFDPNLQWIYMSTGDRYSGTLCVYFYTSGIAGWAIDSYLL
jgi:hypothetical protein